MVLDDLTPLREPALALAINEFDELLKQSSKAFLLGAGCSKCANLPLTAALTDNVLARPDLASTTQTILAEIKKRFDGASLANIEDYLSELVDLLAIAERRGVRGAADCAVSLDGVDYSAAQLQDSVAQIKSAIAAEIDIDVNIETHMEFVRAVHWPSRPGRAVLQKPVDYLVLNYDTLIENALALHKVRYSDGMSGGSSAWWDPATYEAENLSARVLKLHGSIDWIEIAGDPLPRRIAKHTTLPPGHDRKILIWPASTKYRETQRDPYAQLTNQARKVLCPPPGTQTVLTICGYSFGDSHINIEIEKALRESRGELTVAVFTFDAAPLGELKRLHEDAEVRDQIRIYARRGFFHGDTTVASTVDLPWCSFETFVRLLAGER